MRSPIARAALASGLAIVLALPAAAVAAPKRTPYAAAPAQVRKDLARIFADCGAKPDLIRSTARFHTAPVGGRGHRDYLFTFANDWPRPFKSDDYPKGGRCNGNYAWTVLWMDLGGGRYQQHVLENGAVVAKGDDYAVLQAGCDDGHAADGPVSSRAWVLAWNAKHRTFDPLTQCGKTEAATEWLKAHGYN